MKKLTAFMLAVVMVFTQAPMNVYGIETGEDRAVGVSGITIEHFEPLTEDIAFQRIATSPQESVLLPTSLAVEGFAEQTDTNQSDLIRIDSIDAVTWKATDPESGEPVEYDETAVGAEYIFIPVLPQIYILSQDAVPPQIKVVIGNDKVLLAAADNMYDYIKDDFENAGLYPWSGGAIADGVMKLKGNTSATYKEIPYPDTFTVEFDAKINAFIANSKNDASFGFKIEMKSWEKRLMFGINPDVVNYTTAGGTWGASTQFTPGNIMHRYRFDISKTAGTTVLSIDGTEIATITMQTKLDAGTDTQFFGSNNAERDYEIDNFAVSFPVPDDAKPLWTATQAVHQDSADMNSIGISWDAAIGNVDKYKIYKNGSLDATVDGNVTEYSFSNLTSGTEFTFKVEAENGNGTTDNGPSLKTSTFYDPSTNELFVTPLFKSTADGGKEGYGSYRIPGLAVTKQGTLLAYAEARRGGGDWDPMDIVLRRSEDGGNTWSDNILIVPGLAEGKTVNNPVIIVDNDGVTLHMIYCIMYGVEVNLNGGVYHSISTDDGKTWSAPNDISADCRPDEAVVGFKRNVIATGPGHAIQLEDGTLLIAIWMTTTGYDTGAKAHQPSVVSTLYSKDKGETWAVGEIIKAGTDFPNPNESTVIQLADGRVMINMRSQTGKMRRAVSFSENGYSDWSAPAFVEDLVDPGCFGSLTLYDKDTILFTNADSSSGRKNVSVHMSTDMGQTWMIGRSIIPGASAYSDIAVGPDGVIYDLVEVGSSMHLARFTMEWLADGSGGILKSLTPSTGILTPEFSSGTTEYVLEIEGTVDTVELQLKALMSSAEITVNGQTVSGEIFNITNITDPKTRVKIVVVNGEDSRTYVLNIRKMMEVPKNSLVAYYNFDEINSDNQFSDKSNRSNDINISGVTIDTQGKFDNAALFDNKTDCLDLTKGNGINFGSGDFTASVWVKPSALLDSQSFLFWYGTATPGSPQWWVRAETDGRLTFLMAAGSEYQASTATPAVADNEWTHLAFVRKKDMIYIYANGEKKAEKSIPANADVSGDPTLRIGREKANAARPYRGLMDEVRMYNYALSEAELLAMQTFDPSVECSCILQSVKFDSGDIFLNGASAIQPLSAEGKLSDCAIIGHKAEVSYSFALKVGGVNTAGGSVTGANLTVTKAGSVAVTATATCKGISKSADATFIVSEINENTLYGYIDEEWVSDVSPYPWSYTGSKKIAAGALGFPVEGGTAALNNLVYPNMFRVEFKAQVDSFAASNYPASNNSFAIKMAVSATKALTLSMESDGIYGCDTGSMWTKLSDFSAGNAEHTYRLDVDKVSGKAHLYVDGAPITSISLQNREEVTAMQLWSKGAVSRVSSFRLLYPIPPNSKPIWTPSQKLKKSASTTSMVKLEWGSAVGDVTNYKVYKDGALVGTVSGATSEYAITDITSSDPFTVKIEAVNAHGETTDGPSLSVRTNYDPSGNTLDVAPLFKSTADGGKEGYGSYRIPGLVVTKQGTLLAYAEARRGGGDWDPMDIVLRRSEDGGNTWSDNILIVPGLAEGKTVNNPVIIVDNDGVTLHMIYCIMYGVEGLNGGVYHSTSIDDGKSWSEPNDISDGCWPDEESVGFKRNVIATGPGHAIQLEDGTLLIAIWMTTSGYPSSQAHQPSVVSTLYSKDKGETWAVGEIIKAGTGFPNPNESTVIQLADGRVMINMRSQTGKMRRAVSFSDNGYSGWSAPAFVEDLVDPGCFGSLALYNKDTILFTNADSSSGRKNVSVHMSTDMGQTWGIGRSIVSGGSAYSDIAVGLDGVIYDLVEVGPSMHLARFTMDWLVEGSCTCAVADVKLSPETIILSDGSATIKLNAIAQLGDPCAVKGHQAKITYSYAIKADGTNTAGGSVTDNMLTVTAPGVAEITATASANGSSKSISVAYQVKGKPVDPIPTPTPTPTPTSPPTNSDNTSGDSGYLPEDSIKTEAAVGTGNTSTTVSMKRGETKIGASLMDDIINKNKNSDIVIRQDSVTITFNQGTLVPLPGRIWYDFGVQFGVSEHKDEIEKLSGDAGVMLVSYNYSGQLPGTATIRLSVDKNLAGKTVYYNYYNPKAQKLQLIQAAAVDKDGWITVTQTHCSDYIITTSNVTNEVIPVTPNIINPETGGPSDAGDPAMEHNQPVVAGKADMLQQPEESAASAVSTATNDGIGGASVGIVAVTIATLIILMLYFAQHKEQD